MTIRHADDHRVCTSYVCDLYVTGTFVGLTAEPIGYNQLSVHLDLVEEPQSFHALPHVPPRLKVGS